MLLVTSFIILPLKRPYLSLAILPPYLYIIYTITLILFIIIATSLLNKEIYIPYYLITLLLITIITLVVTY